MVGKVLELALGFFNLFQKEGFEDEKWVMKIKTGDMKWRSWYGKQFGGFSKS